MGMQVECQPPSTMAASITKYTMEGNGNAAIQLSMEQVAGSNALTSIELQAQVTSEAFPLQILASCMCPLHEQCIRKLTSCNGLSPAGETRTQVKT